MSARSPRNSGTRLNWKPPTYLASPFPEVDTPLGPKDHPGLQEVWCSKGVDWLTRKSRKTNTLGLGCGESSELPS